MSNLTGVIYSFPHREIVVTRTPSPRYAMGKLLDVLEINEVVTFDSTSDAVNLIDHGLELADGPVQFKAADIISPPTSGALPVGLAPLTNYWIIPIDDDSFWLAASRADALAANYIIFMDDGAGTLTVEAPFTFTIIAGVQPVDGREVNDLPEGSSMDEVLVLYTESKLITRMDPNTNASVGYDPDSVSIDFWGDGFEDWYVYKVEKFTAHYRAYVALGDSSGKPA